MSCQKVYEGRAVERGCVSPKRSRRNERSNQRFVISQNRKVHLRRMDFAYRAKAEQAVAEYVSFYNDWVPFMCPLDWDRSNRRRTALRSAEETVKIISNEG